MGNDRIPWIDALKGFGIFLVTFGHLNPWLMLETHIYSFHICLFFFLSGYLYRKSVSLKTFFVKKTRSMLIPFIAGDILASAAGVLWFGDDLSVTITKFFVLEGTYCWNVPIWFLMMLFITESLYELIMHLNDSKKMKLAVTLIGLLLWIAWYHFSGKKYVLMLNVLPLALFFYGLGDAYKELFRDRKPAAVWLAPLGIASVVFGCVLNGRISYTGAAFGDLLYCAIAMVTGTLFYVLLFEKVPFIGRSRLLRKMGENSLIIMASQYWFFRIYDLALEKKLGFSVWHERNTLKALIVSVITIAAIIGIAEGLKRIFRKRPGAMKILRTLGIR